MTYRNDPYDPKQVGAARPGRARRRRRRGGEGVRRGAPTSTRSPRVKPLHLGDRAPVSLARREIGALPPAAKADAGKRVNEARAAIQAAYDARHAALRRRAGARACCAEETVDVTLPTDRRPRGARHPLTTLMERIGDLFVGMGYEVAEGPEVELEWYNFDALNIAPDHPARTMMDTFYVDVPGLVLRTHTSPVQARTMLDPQAADLHRLPGPGLPHRRAGRHPHARSSTRSRAWWWTRASRWPTSRARWTTSPGRCSARTRRPGCGRRTSRSPSRRPRWTCGSRSTATARAGSSGAAAAWSTRGCCAPAASTRTSTPGSRSAWASSGR